ncbi:hypothetical protein OIU85_021603 [Salix viminalis]|uniref:Uncharacterized protein n=1 Tax=Salix viminalis TaxID=40686 RepID=A0A9Q0ZDS0_SALVM|nr:hypothetical protein OIU85_021603 [Salix viminalis]
MGQTSTLQITAARVSESSLKISTILRDKCLHFFCPKAAAHRATSRHVAINKGPVIYLLRKASSPRNTRSHPGSLTPRNQGVLRAQAGKKSIQSSDARGKFSTHLNVKEAVVEQQQRNDKPKTAEVGSSHEEGELTPKNDMHLNNGHGTSSKLCISPNQHAYSDDSDKSRRAIPNSKIRKSGELGQGRSSRNPLGSPANKDHHEPSTSNHGQGLSHSRSPNGIPKRIRKGRGFTERYAYACKYRSPSPERAPWRYHYGGRNIDGRNRDRLSSYRSYSERSPPRRYRSPPRGRSPLRMEEAQMK